MVDVTLKTPQRRVAKAEGFIRLAATTVHLIMEDRIRKGSALGVAQIAGIQAAKQTSSLIPLCHPLPLTHGRVDMSVEDEGVRSIAEATCVGVTGVEMEALTAVSVSLLTVYDMCKAVDKEMRIEGVHLIEKKKTDI